MTLRNDKKFQKITGYQAELKALRLSIAKNSEDD